MQTKSSGLQKPIVK